MKTIAFAILIAACSAFPAAAQNAAAPATVAVAGKYLFDANGRNLGAIYKVTPAGSAQLILNERMVTVPHSTISAVDGKFTTSLTKGEILKLR